MIPITPVAGLTVLLDVDLIEAIEPATHPIIILVDGRRMVVMDSATVLLERIRRARAARLASAELLEPRQSEVIELRATGSDA